MTRLNPVRILTGGLLAGLVIIVVNIAAQLVLGQRVQDEMNRWIPGAAARMAPTGLVAAMLGLIMKLAIGTVLVWLYAVVRARYGRARTAAILAALTAWVLAAIFFSDFPLTGMISWTTYAVLEMLQLAAFLAAAGVAAWHYREG